MKKTINLYLLKEILIPFFLCLVAFTFVLLMDKIMRLIELVINKGVDVEKVFKLFIFLLPTFLVYVLPVAVLLSMLLAFGRLSSDHEITALKSAGVSLYQLLPPVAAFALAVAVLTAALSLYVAPLTNWGFGSLLFQITRGKASLGIKERIFNNDFQGLTIYVNQIAVGSEVLKGVMVSDSREAKESNIIVADQGYLVPDGKNLMLTLRLEDGSIHRTSKDLSSYRKIDFSTYELKLDLDSALAQDKGKGKRFAEMVLDELRDRMDSLKSLGKIGDLRKAEVELYKKFVFPVAALIFALLGMPLGIQSKRAGRLSGFSLGLGIVFLYYLLVNGGELLAVRGMLPAYLSMGIGNALYLVAGLYFFVTTAREKEFWLANKLGMGLEKVYARLKGKGKVTQ